MQENEVKAPEPQVTKSPEPEQKEAFDRTERTNSQKGPSGRRLVEPGGSGRHERKCNICNHSDRAAIEFDFINWRNPAELVKSFQLRDLSTIYRHAHATGLFARRRLNLRGLMERIAERVSEVPITAAAIIRAARAIAHINDAGEWIDPPTRIIVEHHYHSKRRNGSVTIKKVSHAMFTSENLDEPSPEAASRGERPRIDPKSKSQFPTEVVLEIAPALYEASMERKRRGEADRLAKEAKGAGFAEQAPNVPSATTVILAPWKTAPSGVQAPCHEGTRTGQPVVDAKGVSGTGSQPVENNPSKSVAPSPSSLAPARRGEEAASNSSAPSALSVHESRATEHASRPPVLTARPGSAGSTNPPFPFDPSKQLYRKGRRKRF